MSNAEPKLASPSGTGKPKPKKRVAVQFINASHPRDAASAEAKKRIRAHAARDVHAGRRAHEAQAGQMGVEGANRDTSRIQMSPALRCSDQAALAEAEVEVGRGETVSDSLYTPEPASFLSSARKDPFQSFARAVTETEHFLIDHCISTRPFI